MLWVRKYFMHQQRGSTRRFCKLCQLKPLSLKLNTQESFGIKNPFMCMENHQDRSFISIFLKCQFNLLILWLIFWCLVVSEAHLWAYKSIRIRIWVCTSIFHENPFKNFATMFKSLFFHLNSYAHFYCNSFPHEMCSWYQKNKIFS